MTVILSEISKKGKLYPGSILNLYLSLFPKVFPKEEREDFIFYNGVGGIGLLFEGKIAEKSTQNLASFTVKVANKSFCVLKYRLSDNQKGIEKLKQEVAVQTLNDSSFVILVHTGKWYNNKNWLMKDMLPRITPEGNIYVCYGSIGQYFGFGDDIKHFYEGESRGLVYTSRNKGQTDTEIISSYYGKFLDQEKLNGLVEDTGLRHFTTGIYKKINSPKLFFVRSKTVKSDIVSFQSKDSTYICTSKSLALALRDKTSIKSALKPFLKGNIIEHNL